MQGLSIPAQVWIFLLCPALAASALPPSLISQDSMVVMGDSLAPLALLSGGDRIYTPVRTPVGGNSLKLVRASPDGFRIWESTLAFESYLGRYSGLLEGRDGKVHFHYLRGNSYYQRSIDRNGSAGAETALVTGLESDWSFWPPVPGFADTLAAGGVRYNSQGTCFVNIFTRAGLPVRQVTLQKPYVSARSVAVAEGGHLLLVAWETTDVVRKLFLEKIDPSGASLWRKPFDGGPDGDITSMLILPDGYLVAGYAKSTGPENHDAWLFKIGFDGELRWSRKWGDRWNDRINVVMACGNGGYLLGGQATVFGSKKELHAALWRVNGEGDSVWSLLMPPYPITNLAEPVPGSFHLLGSSEGQKKWFAVLGPENTSSVRTPARKGSGARPIFLMRGRISGSDLVGYDNPLCLRADGRSVDLRHAAKGGMP